MERKSGDGKQIESNNKKGKEKREYIKHKTPIDSIHPESFKRREREGKKALNFRCQHH